MKNLVTGASGFLGRNLVPYLTARGEDCVGLSSADADLRHQGSLAPYAGTKFDRIFHLAAWTQAGDFCLHHPGQQWLINQKINTNVLDWWNTSQPQAKLISIGTSCAYPEGSDHREDGYLEGSPIDDLYAYAMTKRMLYIGQVSLCRQFGRRYMTVVPSTLYGPGYDFTSKQSHFIFDLIRKILRHKHFGDDVVLWGDGEQRREVVLVDDFISTMLELDTIVENEVVNIGAGEDFSIRELAEMICEATGVDKGAIRFDLSRYVGARVKSLNNDKLNSLLPARKTRPLSEGLALTIADMERRIDSFQGKAE